MSAYGSVLQHPTTKRKKEKIELPPPLVKPYRHPIKFIKHQIALMGAGAILTYVGVLIVAAVYYLLLETYPPVTKGWHELVSNGDLRHNIRDVGEGFLGGLLGVMIKWNHYKKAVYKAPNLLDRIEIKLHIPNVRDGKGITKGNVLFLIPLVLLYAVPGFLLGELIVSIFHHLAPSIHELGGTVTSPNPNSPFLEKLKNSVTENWPKKVIGFGAALFFGRRPAKAVFDDAQLWFAERRCCLNKPLRWYHVPTFKARYNEVCGSKHVSVKATVKQTRIMKGLVTVGIVFAVVGFYVLNWVAYHKGIHIATL